MLAMIPATSPMIHIFYSLMNKGIKLLIPLHHNEELEANEVRVLRQSHQPPLEAPVLGFVNIN